MTKIKIKVGLATFFISLTCLLVSPAVFAVPITNSDGIPSSSTTGSSGSGSSFGSIGSTTPTPTQVQKQLNKNPIVNRINDIVTFLAAAVGIIIVGNIIAGGVEYSAAGGNPQQVAAARKRIMNSFLALLFFLLIYAFVQWLVPGGVFG